MTFSSGITLIILNSAGNTGDDQRAYEDIALRVGTCGFYKAGRDKYEVRRDTYSSTGSDVDFTDFRGDISLTSGTSFSTPYTAGKIALHCQRYGNLTQKQAADAAMQRTCRTREELACSGAVIIEFFEEIYL